MAVVLATAAQRYTGVAGDVKPTTGVPPGARFYETDTLRVFIYDGMDWTAMGRTVVTP